MFEPPLSHESSSSASAVGGVHQLLPLENKPDTPVELVSLTRVRLENSRLHLHRLVGRRCFQPIHYMDEALPEILDQDFPKGLNKEQMAKPDREKKKMLALLVGKEEEKNKWIVELWDC